MTSSKQVLHNLLQETFELITPLADKSLITENEYIILANLFGKMNISLDKLQDLNVMIRKNRHYQRREPICRITEDEKVNNNEYELCNCGSFIKTHKNNRYLKSHINTDKHYKLLRAKRLVYVKKDKNIDFEIKREILIESFTLKHIQYVAEG